MKTAFSNRELIFLGAICLLSLALLLIGLNGACPFSLETDEVDYAPHAIWMLKKPTLNPEWFTNPASTLFYPLLAYYWFLHHFFGNQVIDLSKNELRTCYEQMELLVKYPRFVNVLFTTATLPFLYAIGRTWLGRGAATIATILYGVSPLVVRYGQILRTDTFSCLLIVICMFLICHILAKPARTALSVLAALVTALAISTRYFCLGLIVPVSFAYVWLAIKDRPSARRILLNLTTYLLLSGVLTFCFSPFVFLDYGQTLKDLHFEAASEFAEITGLGFFGNLDFYIKTAMPRALGMPLAVGALAGIVLLAFRARSALTATYMVLLAAFLIGTCLNPRHWFRWILPMMPVLCLTAGLAFQSIYEALAVLVERTKLKQQAQKIAFIASAVLLLLSLIPLAYELTEIEVDKLRPTGPEQAWFYIRDHIPAGTKIAVDIDWRATGSWLYDVTENIWRPDFIPPRPHNYYTPEDLAKEGFKYMVVEKWNREYYQAKPKEYPRESNFYEQLVKKAPLVFTSEKEPETLFGKKRFLRIGPNEVYDLRAIGKGMDVPGAQK
jgi:hypothetical protein